jgi:hypothetical protein
MHRISLRRVGVIGVVTAMSTAAVLGMNATNAAAVAPGVSTAFGAQVTANLLGQPALAVGPLAPASSAGPTTNAVANLSLPGTLLPPLTLALLTTGAVTTSASQAAATGFTTANATTATVALPLLGLVPAAAVAITAITATCTGTIGAIAGSTNIVGGTLAGVALPVNPAANTTLTVAGVATIVLNQQIVNADGSLTVNALHITLLGGPLTALIGTAADVVVSSTTCGAGVAPAVVTTTPVPTPTAVNAGHATASSGYLPAEVIGGLLLLVGLAGIATRSRWSRQH